MPRVLIVGAGPAGAVLGLLLARRGIGVTLLERQRDFEREFRGEVLMPSAFTAFEQMGLGGLLASVPQVPLRRGELYLDGRRLARLELGEALFDGRPPAWVSQPRLLEALMGEAARLPGFALERGVSARALLRDRGERIAGVRARGETGEREIRADLVVGADGRSSVVRRDSGAAVSADRVPMDVVWCKLPLPDFLRADPHVRGYLGRGHLLIAAPTPEGLLQLGWVIRKGRFGELRARGVREWIEELARHVSADLASHLQARVDAVSRPFLLDVIADRVHPWAVPGALLIGDAAHTMSPVGAQGINVAIRDALVAANHLVPVLQGEALAGEIDAAAARVEPERTPEVRAIQRFQARAPHLVLTDAWYARALLRLLASLARAPRGRLARRAVRRLAQGVTEVQLRV
jgi:2-polyprenyl-6-methoxyphenol hydroxylase-like FAD-dependent oxidoreductase